MRNYLLSVLSVLTIGPLGGLATPVAARWGNMRVKHEWATVPTKWDSLGPPPVGTTIDLNIALKSHNENALIDTLHKVSDPSHPNYGAYLTKDEMSELVAPHQDTLELVNSWLEHHGVLSCFSKIQGGNWLKLVGVPVPQANDLLAASFELYQHTDTNDTVLRTISYSLPDALHAHVQTITPTTFFGLPRSLWQTPRIRRSGIAPTRKKAKSEEPVRVRSSTGSGGSDEGSGSDGNNSGSDSDGEDEDVNPAYVRWLYKTLGYVPAAVNQNILGIAGYNNDYPSPDDLFLFMEEYRTDGEDATFRPLRLNNGEYNPSHPGVESSVNLQYTAAIAYPTPIVFYSVGGNWDDALNNWLLNMIDLEFVPQTIVTTYGVDEIKVPYDYAVRTCILFGHLGARGVSILFSSGDDGVGEGSCVFKDNNGNPFVQFIPTFPATCPFVTVVGGTTGHTPEIAASLSGGGFSNIFLREAYQDSAVQLYLYAIGNRNNGLYNTRGRAYPDIAAQAYNCEIVVDGQYEVKDGTSCSTPIMGGIVALLNDYRLSKGKPALGFLNPWLYGIGRPGFTDILLGSNPGCNTNGFPALYKWDPVTGLGSPDFSKLEEIIDGMMV